MSSVSIDDDMTMTPVSSPSATMASSSEAPSRFPAPIVSDAPVPLPVQSSPLPSSRGSHTPTRPPFLSESQAYGDSLFGTRAQSQYVRAGPADGGRRPGWSWMSYGNVAPPPFCYQDTCYNATDVCQKYSGTVIADPICAFPANTVQVAGVTCWNGECSADGTSDQTVCETDLRGSYIGNATAGVGWCVVPQGSTVMGPACWGDGCFQTELTSACASLKGTAFADMFCVFPGKHTVAGPLCDPGGICFTGFVSDSCKALEGVNVADRWCILQGCDHTVIGPICEYNVDGSTSDCYDYDLGNYCNEKGGTEIAQRFCILPGSDYSVLGPISYGGQGSSADGRRMCETIGGEQINGRFCMVQGNWAGLGPSCLGGGDCNLSSELLHFCSEKGGFSAADLYCAIENAVVSFPNCWNEECFKGPDDYCDEYFCAIPMTGTEPGKCLSSDSFPDGSVDTSPQIRPVNYTNYSNNSKTVLGGDTTSGAFRHGSTSLIAIVGMMFVFTRLIR